MRKVMSGLFISLDGVVESPDQWQFDHFVAGSPTLGRSLLQADLLDELALMIHPVAVPPLSLAILMTGLILGLGTPWGLVRYWWVLVKLVLSVVMTVLVFTSLVPAVNSISPLAETTMSAAAVRASLGELPTQLMFPPIVSFLMLGAAIILSIFKPWRRTPWSRETRSGPMKELEGQ